VEAPVVAGERKSGEEESPLKQAGVAREIAAKLLKAE
jgi:hypothetical protein